MSSVELQSQSGDRVIVLLIAVEETGNYFHNNDNFLGYCNKCSTVYQYKKANGTTTMSKQFFPPAYTKQVMTATETRRNATATEKKLITSALVHICAIQMRPFHDVNNSGFRNYTQGVLNIGINSKMGKSVENILIQPQSAEMRRLDLVLDAMY